VLSVCVASAGELLRHAGTETPVGNGVRDLTDAMLAQGVVRAARAARAHLVYA